MTALAVGGVLAALVLALVHVVGPRLPLLQALPRPVLVSLAGGVSVGYVFLHILPELSSHRAVLSEGGLLPTGWGLYTVYGAAMLGLLVFYALERATTVRRRRADAARTDAAEDDAEDARGDAFWVHIGMVAFNSFIIGYLVQQRDHDSGWLGLGLYTFALGLHFVLLDSGLQRSHQDAYQRRARWLLALAVLAGALVGIVLALPDVLVAALFSFVGGGIVLNALKEELPEDRESSIWAFGAGAVAYGALLALVG